MAVGTYRVAIESPKQLPVAASGLATIAIVMSDDLIAAANPAGMNHLIVNPCRIKVRFGGRSGIGSKHSDGV